MLHLLDGPYLTRDGRRHSLPDSGARLVAFVALHGRQVDRRHAAGSLWPSCGDDRAAANLRSTLWRLAQCAEPSLEITARHLYLADDIAVDVHLMERWAINEQAPSTPPLPRHRSIDLMPSYDDQWVMVHRERIRQRMLYALESKSRALLADGRVDEGLALAAQALGWDPARESAVRMVVACLLARGDRGAAQHTYHRYCRGLRHTLAVRPGPRLSNLVR